MAAQLSVAPVGSAPKFITLRKISDDQFASERFVLQPVGIKLSDSMIVLISDPIYIANRLGKGIGRSAKVGSKNDAIASQFNIGIKRRAKCR
jgi:hypothetical protein